MDYLRADDTPIPCYVDTERPVAVGHRGACPVAGGVGGLVVGLQARTNEHGRVIGWTARLRYPNSEMVTVEASELHWVEPHRSLMVYLHDDDVEEILRSAQVDWSRGLVDRILEAVSEAAEEEAG